jgi:putative DNA primase/helicase
MPDGNGGTMLLDLPDDVRPLMAAVQRYEAALLIIDPVLTMLGGDMNKDQDARKALAPLRDMAEETGVTVVAVRHLNKNVSLSAIQRGGGNMGLIGVARAGAFFAHHPDEDGLRVMAPHKSNLAAKQPSLQYVIKGWAIDENIGRVEWLGVTEHDANSLASDAKSPGEKSELDAAKEFLQAELEDGPVWAKQIFKDARDAGIAQKTLYRAKAVLGVKSEKEGTEGWSWHLPHKDGQKPPHDHVDHVGHVPKSEDGPSPKTPYLSEDGQGGQDGQHGQPRIDDHLNDHHPLSADEANERVQRLIDQGMREEFAAAEVEGGTSHPIRCMCDECVPM